MGHDLIQIQIQRYDAKIVFQPSKDTQCRTLPASTLCTLYSVSRSFLFSPPMYIPLLTRYFILLWMVTRPHVPCTAGTLERSITLTTLSSVRPQDANFCDLDEKCNDFEVIFQILISNFQKSSSEIRRVKIEIEWRKPQTLKTKIAMSRNPNSIPHQNLRQKHVLLQNYVSHLALYPKILLKIFLNLRPP
jgi:hypothetical protein